MYLVQWIITQVKHVKHYFFKEVDPVHPHMNTPSPPSSGRCKCSEQLCLFPCSSSPPPAPVMPVSVSWGTTCRYVMRTVLTQAEIWIWLFQYITVIQCGSEFCQKKKKALICYAVRMGLFLACRGSQLWNLCLRISPLFNNAGCADQNSNSTVSCTSVSFCSMGVGAIWGRSSCSLAATLVTTGDNQSLEPSKIWFINALNFAWLCQGEGELEVSGSPGGLVKTGISGSNGALITV